MNLRDRLLQKRDSILERWFNLIAETYPIDSSKIIKQEKDRFTNPLGYTISQEIRTIYDELIGAMDSERLYSSLSNILHIRTVQDFLPSQAVAFIYLLKEVIRKELVEEDISIIRELFDFELRIDRLSLLALDVYMACCEQVNEIKLNEIKAEREQALRLLARANLICTIVEPEPDSEGRAKAG